MLTHEQREDISRAVETMRRGGVILYPTDTIWGLGCDATNAEAVAKIYAIKQREDAKALISLVDSEAKIDFYVPDVPDVAWQLLEVAERPLTIIYDNVRNLAPNLKAEDGSAALRITREEFSQWIGFVDHQTHGFVRSDRDPRMSSPLLAFKIDVHVCSFP